MKRTLKSVLIVALAVSCIIFIGSAIPAHAGTASYKMLFRNSDFEDGEAEEYIGGKTFAIFDNSYYEEDSDYEDDSDDMQTYELDWYDDNNVDGTVISEDCTSSCIATDGDTVFYTELKNKRDCLMKYTCSTDKKEVIKTTNKDDYLDLATIRGNLLFIDSSSKPMSIYGLDLQSDEFFKITGGFIQGFSGPYFLCGKCSVPCDDFVGAWYIYKMDGHKCVPVKKLTSFSNMAKIQSGHVYYVKYNFSGKKQAMSIYSINADGTGNKKIKTLKAKSIYAVDINKNHCWYVANNKTWKVDFSNGKIHKVSNTVLP